MRSSGSRVDWKIFLVIFAKLIPRKIFFCSANILVLMVLVPARRGAVLVKINTGNHFWHVPDPPGANPLVAERACPTSDY